MSIFADLPIGARFRFFEGGSLSIKTGVRSYDTPQWRHYRLMTDPGQKVIPASPDPLDDAIDDAGGRFTI